MYLKRPTMNYFAWIKQLKAYALQQGFTDKGIRHTDWDAFKDYYIDGYSPKEALDEDLSYA